MKCRVVFTDAEGNCCVMQVVDDPKRHCVPREEGETDEEFALRVAIRDAPEGAKDFRCCCETKVPRDRTFRNAWKQDLSESDDEICVCMEKARPIHLNRLRAERNKKLQKLDLEAVRAMEEDDQQKLQAVRRRKRKLRDMPLHAELSLTGITDPDELKAFVPKELKEEGVEVIPPIGGDQNPNK